MKYYHIFFGDISPSKEFAENYEIHELKSIRKKVRQILSLLSTVCDYDLKE